MPPLYRQLGSLFRWVGAFCIRKADYLVLLSDTRGYLPVSLPTPFYLALPTVTQFHVWAHPTLGSLSASVNGYGHCSLCLMYVFLPKSAAKSHYLWSSPILSGHSGRCPWEKPQLPIFPPHRSFTGRSLGDCLNSFLLWCPLFSPHMEVVLCGVRLVHLSHL